MEQHDDSQDDDAIAEDPRVSRRDALRKAAAGAAVAGAVWAAPRVEGLSVVPDYAAAATGSAPAITLNADVPSSCDPSSDVLRFPSPQTSWTINASGPTGSNNAVANANMAAPGPVILADVTVNFPSSPGAPGPAAGDGSYDFSIDFTGIDPPFNNCRVSAVNVITCPNSTVSVPLGPQPYNNSPPTQRNPVAAFSVPITLPPAAIQDVYITVTCA